MMKSMSMTNQQRLGLSGECRCYALACTISKPFPILMLSYGRMLAVHFHAAGMPAETEVLINAHLKNVIKLLPQIDDQNAE